ncbi:MAG: hypothetical protein PHW52_00460 [Candidatus Pacebacteria bacterium]|nr:hypothetical protein [Candidatus Paceibacterota bacterium]
MEDLEIIFQKINKDSYDLRNHKTKLGLILQNNKYFDEKDNYWDMKTIVTSLSFSILVIIMTMSLSPQTTGTDTFANNTTLYDRLVRNSNTSSFEIANGRAIEIRQSNVKTTLYFNSSKKLVNSITNK